MTYEPDIVWTCDRSSCRIDAEFRKVADGILEYSFAATSADGASLKSVSASWRVPQKGILYRWHPMGGVNRSIPPDWTPPETVDCTSFMPLIQLIGPANGNVLTFAFSDSSRPVEIKAAVREETSEIVCELTVPFSGIHESTAYSARLRIDLRNRFYAEVIGDASRWMEGALAFSPVPESAWLPAYSSWYSFHQHLSEPEIEEQCRIARNYGMRTLILDDGWQTGDCNRGYAFCGDWEPDPVKFPDFAGLVRRVHELGFHCVLWCALSLMGVKSKCYGKFKNKILATRPNGDSVILDPRYPDVRDYLADTLVSLVRNYDLDGLKLDFVDSFLQPGAGAEVPPESDCSAVGEGVEKLLDRIIDALSAEKPDFLIEFRQRYIGPRMRCRASILRATDCPGDIISNRVRTIDLRLGCPGRAVHSDMITWNYDEPAESAALQLLNILFSVPQISLRLDEIPDGQRRMLDFWMRFFQRYRRTLLHGKLRPLHPELNYPLVYAEGEDETIAAAYMPELSVDFSGTPSNRSRILVNASGVESRFFVSATEPLKNIRIYDAFGNTINPLERKEINHYFIIPASGVLVAGLQTF